MKGTTRTAALALALMLPLAGCATGYQSRGVTGGFTETKLNSRTYQVRFQGNGYTSPERTSVFLLRRCAELTLENGHRYFTLGHQESGSQTTGALWMTASFPNGIATVSLMDEGKDDQNALDAVTVVRETDTEAGHRLSGPARLKLREFEGALAPIPEGTVLYLSSGERVGVVIRNEFEHDFSNGRHEDAVFIRSADGGEAWLTLKQAHNMVPPSPK